MPAAVNLGRSLYATGRYEETAKALRSALKRSPDYGGLQLGLARVLATAPVEGLRDGNEALGIMKEICTKSRAPEHLEILAAAQAETGDFQAAIRTVDEAIAASSDKALTQRLQRAHQSFERGVAIRAPGRE